MKLEELVRECLIKGINVCGVELKDNKPAYRINGFGKSGYAILYEKNDKIYSETRYNTIDEIEDFRDLAYVAYHWIEVSISRGCPIDSNDSNWFPIFKEYEFDINALMIEKEKAKQREKEIRKRYQGITEY